MSLSQSLQAQAAYCLDRLAEIRQRHDREAKPFLDILARIKAMEVPTFIVAPSEMPELVNLKRQTAPPKATHETFDDYGFTIFPNGSPRP